MSKGKSFGIAWLFFFVIFRALIPHEPAVAIALFGTGSPAALATIAGGLVEVPVMVMLVKVANKTRGWFPA